MEEGRGAAKMAQDSIFRRGREYGRDSIQDTRERGLRTLATAFRLFLSLGGWGLAPR